MTDPWRDLVQRRGPALLLGGCVIVHPTPGGGLQLLTHPLHDSFTRQRAMMVAYAVVQRMP